jgi:hypothetical protein
MPGSEIGLGGVGRAGGGRPDCVDAYRQRGLRCHGVTVSGSHPP